MFKNITFKKWRAGYLLIILIIGLPIIGYSWLLDGLQAVAIALLPVVILSFVTSILYSLLYLITSFFTKARFSITLILCGLSIYFVGYVNSIMHWPGAKIQVYSSISLLAIGILLEAIALFRSTPTNST